MPDLKDLRLADFEPLRESSFRLSGEGLPEPLALRLVETRSLTRADGAGERRQPFGLVFRGPRDPVLPQRIYRVEHDALGAQEIFLVPIRRDGEGTDYEAIFT
ncbi:MAG TPA: hypothetical protein VHM02_07950 [Thermoanaerobaculia bacterium]|nr:hypothetical protein [Thermoanaerobaculia bacterium]